MPGTHAQPMQHQQQQPGPSGRQEVPQSKQQQQQQQQSGPHGRQAAVDEPQSNEQQQQQQDSLEVSSSPASCGTASRLKHGHNPLCLWCGLPITHLSHAHGDHVKPYSKGGLTHADNLALLHSSCNQVKGNRYELWEGPYAQRLRGQGLPLPQVLRGPQEEDLV